MTSNNPSESGTDTHHNPVDRVKESNGDLVLDFTSRVGARPYARYVDGEWELMSLTYIPTPKYGEEDETKEHGFNTTVHTVDLEPNVEDHTEGELREMAEQPRYPDDSVSGFPGVEVIPFEESPFEHRDEIPAKQDIVRQQTCDECGEGYKLYVPEPQSQCPHCDATLEQSLEDLPQDVSEEDT